MTARVCIVDYGIGNLFSVARAVEKAGGEAILSSDPAEVAAADRLLLPGVGAFEPCVRTLHERNLADPVRAFVATGRPFLGICVGMQLMFEHSLEFGRHAGLGLLKGHVAPIPATDEDGHVRKVPHIGWAPLIPSAARPDWDGTVLDLAIPGQTSMYFVHSYSCVPTDRADLLAEADYEGFRVCAAVQRDNMTGFQSHPEKSGSAGLNIIGRFLQS